MKYLSGFFGGLVTIMMHIIPVTILWTLLTGEVIFGMDVVGNFMGMVTALGNAGMTVQRKTKIVRKNKLSINN